MHSLPRGALPLLAAALLWAGGAAAAAPCGGDCNGDGRIGIDELIAGVAAALGAEREACGVDLDDDGRVAVGELVRLVGVALRGCPLPFDAAVMDGVYEADARGQTDPSGGFNKRGVAVIAARGADLEVVIHFGPLETLQLRATPLPDGTLGLDGSGVQSGEFAVAVGGSLAVAQEDGVVALRGVLDFTYAVVPAFFRLDVSLERPLAGTPAAYGGTHRFLLRHPMPDGAAPTSRIDLPLGVPRSGRARCGAAADVLPDGGVRAELPAAACLVSASGRFLYAAPYLWSGDRAPVPLHMTGTLRHDGVGRGTFYIAEFPTIAESGVWQVEPIRAAGGAAAIAGRSSGHPANLRTHRSGLAIARP